MMWMGRNPAVVVAMVSLLAGGCSSGAPGVTHSREVYWTYEVRGPAWNPDSTSFAFAIGERRFRRAIGLNAFPDGGVPWTIGGQLDVYVYGLASRSGPRKVATRRLEPFSLLGWESDGILLRTGPLPRQRHLLIDPTLGVIRPLTIADGARLAARFARPRASVVPYDSRGFRDIQFLGGQCFLWEFTTRTRVPLFDLPGPPRGTVGLNNDNVERRRWRYSDSVHQIWTMEGRVLGESLEVDLRTFVPRPGGAWTDYELMVAVDVLDTAAARRHVYRYDPRTIATVSRRLSPEPQRIIARVAFDQALEWVRLHDAATGIQDRSSIAVWARLTRRSENGDSAGHPGVLNGSSLFANVRLTGVEAGRVRH